MKKTSLLRCIISLAFLAVITGSAAAQGGLGQLLRPEINEYDVYGTVTTTHFESEDFEDRPGSIGWTDVEANFWLQPARTETSEWGINLQFANKDLNAHSDIDDLQDASLGIGYRRILANDWLAGGLLSIGSASDEPFDGMDECYIAGWGLLRVPSGASNAWLFLLNLNTTHHSFPVIPTVGYQMVRDDWQAVVGLPFLMLSATPTQHIELSAYAFPPGTVDARATYRPNKALAFFTGFTWGRDSYYLADRSDHDDQLVFEDKRAELGVAFGFSRHARLEVTGGYAFDQTIGYGEDEDERDDNEVDIDDSWFGRLKFEFLY